jgi:hypothetical protein
MSVMPLYLVISGGRYMNLINGQADLILGAREPSADELAVAKAAAVTLDVRHVAQATIRPRAPTFGSVT